MKFVNASLEGVRVIELEPHYDERGSFSRIFCEREFSEAGIESRFEQSSLSRNLLAGTLRGMHYQASPDAEVKVVRCVRGAIFDVALDIRPGSQTFCCWFGAMLSADNGRALLIPAGFAHGFQTLEDNTDVLYQITPPYCPGAGLGVRWNDPRFGIDWPLPNPTLSERDASYPDFVCG